MQFDSTIGNAFVCPCELSRTLAHAAVPCTVKDNVLLKCSISGTPLGLADDKQTVWLPSGSHSSQGNKQNYQAHLLLLP